MCKLIAVSIFNGVNFGKYPIFSATNREVSPPPQARVASGVSVWLLASG